MRLQDLMNSFLLTADLCCAHNLSMQRTLKADRSQTRMLGLLKRKSGVRTPASQCVWPVTSRSGSPAQRRVQSHLPQDGRVAWCLPMLVGYFVKSIAKLICLLERPAHCLWKGIKKQFSWALWATTSRDPSPHSLLEDTAIPKAFWQPMSLCIWLKLVSVGLCVRH